MFEKLKSNLCHHGTLCLSWAYMAFIGLVSKKHILLMNILVFSYLLGMHWTFYIMYFMHYSLLMNKNTTVHVMSLGHKSGVLITVPSLFRRINKMWRLHLVIFIFCRYKTWYKTCPKSAEFHNIFFNKEYWWMHREFFGTLWKTVPELFFGPQPFNFTPGGLRNVSF